VMDNQSRARPVAVDGDKIQNATPKRAYSCPHLTRYGSIAALTASGSGQVIEAFVQVQPVMVCATVVSARACNAG